MIITLQYNYIIRSCGWLRHGHDEVDDVVKKKVTKIVNILCNGRYILLSYIFAGATRTYIIRDILHERYSSSVFFKTGRRSRKPTFADIGPRTDA